MGTAQVSIGVPGGFRIVSWVRAKDSAGAVRIATSLVGGDLPASAWPRTDRAEKLADHQAGGLAQSCLGPNGFDASGERMVRPSTEANVGWNDAGTVRNNHLQNNDKGHRGRCGRNAKAYSGAWRIHILAPSRHSRQRRSHRATVAK